MFLTRSLSAGMLTITRVLGRVCVLFMSIKTTHLIFHDHLLRHNRSAMTETRMTILTSRKVPVLPHGRSLLRHLKRWQSTFRAALVTIAKFLFLSNMPGDLGGHGNFSG